MLLPERRRRRGAAVCSISRTPLLGPASYDLVSLLEDARRDVPPALRAAMTERYLAAFPDARSRRVPALRRDPRGAAQLQDHRHLHPAVAARRQARLSRPYSPRLASARSGRCSAIRRWRRSPRWLDRHLPAGAAPRARGAQRGMIAMPQSAMVLAAGLGTRMRPITEQRAEAARRDRRPRPARPRDRPAGAGRGRARRRQPALQGRDGRAAHLAAREHPRIELSREDELLETGGGVSQALPLLGELFFVVNGDVFWLDGRDFALARLARGLRSGAARRGAAAAAHGDARSATRAAATISSIRSGDAAPARRARDRAVSSSPASRSCTAGCSTASPSGASR